MARAADIAGQILAVQDLALPVPKLSSAAARRNRGGGPRPGRFPLACLEVERPPEAHYDCYPQGACHCALCQEWLSRLHTAQAAAAATAGHSKSCMCAVCKEARRAAISLLVAENIRDLWGELSWAAWMEGWDKSWMDWFYEELADQGRTLGWWASKSSHFSLATWYGKWEKWLAGRPPAARRPGRPGFRV